MYHAVLRINAPISPRCRWAWPAAGGLDRLVAYAVATVAALLTEDVYDEYAMTDAIYLVWCSTGCSPA